MTAQNGETAQTYTVTVTRAGSADATLSGLSLSGMTLSPAFASGTASVRGFGGAWGDGDDGDGDGGCGSGV